MSWQASVGKAVPGFAPAVLPDAIYVAAVDGSLVRLDPANGRQVWRTQAGKTISAGPGADGDTIVGYFFIGTPGRPLEERPRPDYDEVVRAWDI